MATLNIDGIGRVEVGNEFAKLPPDQQAAEVDAIAAQIKPRAAAPPAVAIGGAAGPGATAESLRPQFGEQAEAAAAFANRKPTDVVERGTILPLGKTAGGELTLAVPEFIAGPLQTIADIMSGKKTSQDISGKEMFELGALFSNVSAATGTGAGIARAAAERGAVPAAEKAGAAAAPAAGPVSASAATIPEIAPVAPAAGAAAAPVAAPVAAAAVPVEAAAARGGLHSTPETLALRGKAKAGFKVLDDSSIVVNPQSFKPLTQEIFSDAALKGLDETITPASTAVIKRLNAVADEPITLQSLNTLREVASGAAGSRVPKDQMIAERIIDRLDGFMSNLKAKDLMLGAEADTQAVAQAVKNARATWAEMSKLEVVSRLVQRAQDSVAQRPQLGMENVLRNEFTALAKNDKQMAKFTPEERAAVREVTRGATKAFMRGMGRLAARGPVSAFTGGSIGGTATTALGLGPIPGMIATFGAGEIGRKLATVLTQRSIKNLEGTIKGDVVNPLVARGRVLSEQIAAGLKVGASAQSAEPPRRKR